MIVLPEFSEELIGADTRTHERCEIIALHCAFIKECIDTDIGL